MSEMPSEAVLRWAAEAVGAGARVVTVKALRDDSRPWLLHIERGGSTREVVLRAWPVDRSRIQAIDTGAAALETAYPVAARVRRRSRRSGCERPEPLLRRCMPFLSPLSVISRFGYVRPTLTTVPWSDAGRPCTKPPRTVKSQPSSLPFVS
jgi:hypothetical protein